MNNLYLDIKNDPIHFRQIVYDELMFAEYTCPLEQKKVDFWSENNYFVHVLKGKKIWHTPYGSWDLREGDCILVKKGACIVEQFFDEEFCLIIFFFPDSFIRETLKDLTINEKYNQPPEPIISVNLNDKLKGYFYSIMPYFSNTSDLDRALVKLKFRELIINLAVTKENKALNAYFRSVKDSSKPSIQEIMEYNFSYNLKLQEYASLCCRSLSSFKRDFRMIYQTSPQRWLTERRLNYAKTLLETTGKPVSDVLFESGFENLSHFSRAFKQKFSVSPSKFRQENRSYQHQV